MSQSTNSGANATNEVKKTPPPHMPHQQRGPPTNMGVTNQPIETPQQQPGVVTNMEVMSQPNNMPQQESEIMTIQKTVPPFRI